MSARRISWMVRGRPAAPIISATVPETHGAAMLVPDFTHRRGSSPCQPLRGVERAARMRYPGAAISGFCRPSAVGPRLVNRVGGRLGWVPSYAPTATARKQLQIVFVV